MIRSLMMGLVAAMLAAGAAWGAQAAGGRCGAQEIEQAGGEIAKEGGQGETAAFVVERLEFQSNNGEPLFVWDAEGRAGGERHKLWVKTEGAYLLEESSLGVAEVQGLYSYAIGPHFDVQAGIRHDFGPDPAPTFAVLGVEGLAPFQFEITPAVFISSRGNVLARLEVEYDFLLTQTLILQPRTELNFAVQDVQDLGIGSGLSTVELGARLRYKIKGHLAPYIGVSWDAFVGRTAEFARSAGVQVSVVSLVAGLGLRF